MLPDFDPKTGARIGPYTVRGPLGRGGMATVYEVEDSRDGQLYAMKLLRSPRPEVVERFESEFRTLASMDHPHVIRVFEQGAVAGRSYFVMERLRGQDLRGAVEAWRALRPAERFQRAEAVLVQVARALAYIHDRGVVHRDVTPGNIMVEPDGAVRLMDFGVVKGPGADLTVAGEMIGTVAYSAPEQLQGEAVDARTDLYALGAVLYLMLTGRRPFNASTLGGYVDKHLRAAPRPPQEVMPTVPARLDAICLRLLEKDPAARFGSAHHLLSALGEREPIGDMKRWPPRPVGRVAELARLRARVADLAAGRGGVISLAGGEGSGKSQLLHALASQARDAGLDVDFGACVAEPYGGFRQLLPTLAPAGAPLAPALDAALRGRGAAEPYAVQSALRDLLRDRAPRAVILDDLDEADRGSRALFRYLVRNLLILEPAPVLFAFSWRGEGLDPLGDLDAELSEAGGPALQLALPPISEVAVEELLLQLLPHDERAGRLAARLHQVGEGNPYLIREMIRGLVDEGAIAPDVSADAPGFTLALDDIERAQLPIPASIREALLERLSGLSPQAREVASLVALFRHEVTLDVLLEALAADEEELEEAVEELVDGGVLLQREIGTEEVVELARSRFGEILTAAMDPAVRRDLHARAGLAMERLYRHRLGSVVESLAWHFERGEVPAKACPYLFRAGQQLMERSFVPEAIAAFDRALTIEPEARAWLPLDEADQRLTELRLSRGQALQHIGSWEEAARDLKTAARLARDLSYEQLRCRAIAQLGDLAIRESRFQEAEALFTEALELADALGDSRLRLGSLYGMGQSRWNQRDLEGARHYWLEALAVAGALQDNRALGQAYRGMGLVAVCRGQSAEARKFLEQSCQRFEKIGQIGDLAISRVNLVEFYHFIGNLRKGLKLAERTIAQAREVHHLQGIALGLHYRSLILVDLGRLQEAEENAREALQIVEGLNSGEDTFNSYVYLARIALAGRKYDRAGALLDQLDEMGDAYDSEGYTPVLLGWRAHVRARQGAAPDDVRATLEAAGDRGANLWPHQRVRLSLISARALGACGETAEAATHAKDALQIADRCGYRFYSLKAHLLLSALDATPRGAERHSKVGQNLARSLSASLSREDAASFLAAYAPESP